MQRDFGIYVYCLTYAGAATVLDEHPVAEGAEPVFAWVHGDLAAVVARVPLEDWEGAVGEANLERVSWATLRTLQHEQLVERLAHKQAVLPLPFGTICSSLGLLEAVVTQQRELIVEFLEFMSDKEQWALAGHLDPQRFEQEINASAAGALSAAETRDQTCQRCLALVRHLARDLTPLVAQIRPLSPPPSPDGGEVVLDWALLVERRAVADVVTAVGALGDRHVAEGLSLELHGPLPPYDFCPRLELEQTPDSSQMAREWDHVVAELTDRITLRVCSSDPPPAADWDGGLSEAVVTLRPLPPDAGRAQRAPVIFHDAVTLRPPPESGEDAVRELLVLEPSALPVIPLPELTGSASEPRDGEPE